MPGVPFVTLTVISDSKRQTQKKIISRDKENISFRIPTERPTAERLSSGERRRPSELCIWYLEKALQLEVILTFGYNN